MNLAISSTGGRVGAIMLSPSHTHRLVETVRAWIEGRISLGEVRDIELCLPQRRSLALVVNNECNLSCSHCYLQIPQLSGDRLNVAEWQQVIDSAVQDGIQQFLIVGKEVLLGQTGPEVLALLGKVHEQHPSLRTGIMTNGVLLHKYFDLVEGANLSHMDISMEGDAQDHDAIRGAGAFDAVSSNVEAAARLLGEKLFVTLTLQKRNIRRLDKALMAFSSLGVRSVSFAPYKAMPYTDASLELADEDYLDFLANLKQLGQLPLPHEMMLQVDACAACPEMLLHFMQSKWFNLDAMVANGTGSLYLNRRLKNGLIISFRFQPWDLSFDLHARVAVNGSIVCAVDAYNPRAYPATQLANIRDFDFDFGAASLAASVSPRLSSLDSKFESEVAPVIRAAYRNRPESYLVTSDSPVLKNAQPQLAATV